MRAMTLAVAALALQPMTAQTEPAPPKSASAVQARPAIVGLAVPIELANKTIYIRVAVAGKPLWFILDTGVDRNVIDLDVARKLSLPLGDPVQVGGGGAATLTGYLVKTGEVVVPPHGGSASAIFIALPLDDLARLSGHEVSGIIGAQLFSRFVVEVDYKAHLLRLYDPAHYRYRGHGATLPITFNSSGHPVIAAAVVGDDARPLAGRFVFDIGSGATVILNRPFVDKNGFLGAGRRTVPWLAGHALGGGVAGQVGRIKAFTIGPFTLRDPVVIFSQATAGAFAGADEQGNVGSGLLERFKIILDYPHKRIVLERTPGLDRPFEYDQSGITWTAAGPGFSEFQVTGVADNSPGAAAGIRAGDVLVTVNGPKVFAACSE